MVASYKTSSDIDGEIVSIIEEADSSNTDAAFALASAAGIKSTTTDLTRRILELAVQRIRDSKPDQFRSQIKSVSLPKYDDKSLSDMVKEASQRPVARSTVSNVTTLRTREIIRNQQKVAREANLARTIFDQWIVNGKRLGDATRFDLETERDSDATIADGLNRNIRFYQSLIDVLQDSETVRSRFTVETINRLRETAYHG